MFPTDGDKDAEIAHNENMRLQQGQQVQLSPIDDDQVHIVEHTDAAKAIRGADPSSNITLHLQHIGMHRIALQQKMADMQPKPPAPPEAK